MSDQFVLMIASNDQFLQLLRWQLQDHRDGRCRIAVAGGIDQATGLVEALRPRLIVIHWSPGWRPEDLSPLLWATTIVPRPIPVVVVADWYRAQQATQLYRMGVTDYISRSHHQPQLAGILETYLGRRPIDRAAAVIPAGRCRRPDGSRARSPRAAVARTG